MVVRVDALAEMERSDFADLLDELTPEQWAMPTLCAQWTVQEVVAHTVAYLGQTRAGLAMNMVRSRFDIDRLNARGIQRYAKLGPQTLTELMRGGDKPSGAGALYGGRVALIECLVHQQDIRRPLSIPRVIPEQRLRVSLNYARMSPVIAGARRTRGVRLVATDVDWAAGSGLEVRAPAEALLLVMTGRAAAILGELSGGAAQHFS